MGYLPPPQLATGARPSYAEAYTNILTAHRRSPLTSASSVIILVSPDVDAVCAARMLADLFKQDDVIYRIIPVSGIMELERVRDELMSYSEVCHGVSSLSYIYLTQRPSKLHTLILLNMGGILDLPSSAWFGDFSLQITVHVIDSTRPQNLASLFGAGENGERIVVWDDGEVDKLGAERKAWEALMVRAVPTSCDVADIGICTVRAGARF